MIRLTISNYSQTEGVSLGKVEADTIEMRIFVNGEEQMVSPPLTVLDLLHSLDYPVKGIAVERNLEIVPKSRHGQTEISDGDRIEIVQFVGGG